MQIQNLEKVYGNCGNVTHALKGVSFNVYPGEYVGVMGASGSGKTTLLNCVSTIDCATAGHILIDGKDIAGLKPSAVADFRCRKLGFIFQDCNLLDILNGYENIALALAIAGTDPRKIDSKVRAVALWKSVVCFGLVFLIVILFYSLT